MGIEIERKFTIQKDLWKKVVPKKTKLIFQGYLHSDSEKYVRVGVRGTKGCITIKSNAYSHTRGEFEYEIPVLEAKMLLKNFCKNTIKKRRHIVIFGNNTWEVDEFMGKNKGLFIAEIELLESTQEFKIPEWIEKEVTGDKKYYNTYISEHPFSTRKI